MNDVSMTIYRFLPVGGVLFDVGANVGEISRDCAKQASRVVAVEPSEKTFAELTTNLPANVTAVRALCGVSGERRVFLDNDASSTGATSVALGSAAPTGHTYLHPHEMTSVSIDELAAKYGDPDVIKIDVEGHELGVLDGAIGVLKRKQPVVIVEFNAFCLSWFGRVNPADFLETLMRRFDSIQVMRGAQLEPLGDPYAFFHSHLMGNGCVDNLVCK